MADGRTGRGRGISSWPSHPALQRRPPSQACPQSPRPAADSQASGQAGGLSQKLFDSLSPGCPPFTSPSSHAHYQATSSDLKPAGLSGNPSLTTCSCVTRGSHFPSLGLCSDGHRDNTELRAWVLSFSWLEVGQRPGTQAAPVEYTWAIIITESDRL